MNKINCMSRIDLRWSRAIERETSEDPTMFFLVICVLFSCIHSPLGENIEFTRSEETCNLRYTSETQASKGNRYVQPKKNLTLCCAHQITASKLTLDMKKRDKNCCVEGNTAIVGGLRPCAGRMIMTTFIPPTGKQKDLGNDPFDRLGPEIRPFAACLNYDKTNQTAKLEDNQGYHLIPVVDGNKCKDSKKPWHIKWMGIAPGYKKLAYSWCCAKDIYSDYSLDPKTLCCGLSGAQSNYYAKGAQIMPDNPTCCRKIDYGDGPKPFCEPYVLNSPSGNSPYLTCPPPSGLYDVTPNLDEVVPRGGPYYYAYPDKVASTDDLYTVSHCNLGNKFKSFTYFYSYFDMEDHFHNISGYEKTIHIAKITDGYGLCCSKKDAFALSKHDLIRFCCTTITTNYDRPFIGSRKVSCFQYDSKRGGFGTKYFSFRACRNSIACDASKLVNLKFLRTNYSVKKSTDTILYGSQSYYVSKNVKVTGRVPITKKNNM